MEIDQRLKSMSIAEKVQLMEKVWDSLCQEKPAVKSLQWQAEILAERQRQIASGEMTISPWLEAKERLQKLGQ